MLELPQAAAHGPDAPADLTRCHVLVQADHAWASRLSGQQIEEYLAVESRSPSATRWIHIGLIGDFGVEYTFGGAARACANRVVSAAGRAGHRRFFPGNGRHDCPKPPK